MSDLDEYSDVLSQMPDSGMLNLMMSVCRRLLEQVDQYDPETYWRSEANELDQGTATMLLLCSCQEVLARIASRLQGEE